MSEEIESQHLQRKAILYVRQSSSFQVQHNEESRKLQYTMQQRLRSLGWQQVDVIDDDLGRSAAGGVVRSGVERMVADVCLGKVGAVAAREVSRFAPQQPRLAETGRSLPCRPYLADWSGDGLHTSAKQRSSAVRPEREFA